VAVREQVRRWVSMSRSRWSTALGRGTYGVCVVGQDGQVLLRTLHRRFAGCCASSRFSKPGRFEHATPQSYTASTPRRRDTLECTCCSEGGSWPSCAKALLVAASGWEADCAVDAFYTRIATVPQRQPSRCRGFTRWFTATKRWWTSSARWRAPFASRRCVRSRIRSSVRPQLPHARR
jgi:hypothetical protein